nr:hypothetical protein [Tanacetum cinerariifolium]
MFLAYRAIVGFGNTGGLDLAFPINRLSCHGGIQWVQGRIMNSLPAVGIDQKHHEVDIEDLSIEKYLKLTQESQTPKKFKDMTIAKYLEYKKKVNENHISNTESYSLTDFVETSPICDLIWESAHYFDLNQPGTKSDYDLEEEDENLTDDEVVMSEQEESNHAHTQNIKHFEEKDDVDKWLNAEIEKHMNIQGVENIKDALISIIKTIRKEMKDDIVKEQFEASTANISNETSFSNEEDKDDNNTSLPHLVCYPEN